MSLMAGDVKVAVASATQSSTDSATQDYTISGFGTPKAALIIASADASDGVSATPGGRSCIGFFDGTRQGSLAHQDEDASAKVDCDGARDYTKGAQTIDIAGSPTTITASFITDGVRLTNDATQAWAGFVQVVLFGGADFSGECDTAIVGSNSGNTATKTYNTSGLDPHLVMFIGIDKNTDGARTGIINSFGIASINAPTRDTFVNRCMSWTSDHNNTAGAPSSVLQNNRCLSMVDESGGLDWGIELTAATADGFTITTRDVNAGASMEVFYLALHLDDRASKIGSVTGPTTTADWSPSVSLGFTPQYVGLGMTALDTGVGENTIDSTGLAGSHGISNNTGTGEEKFCGWYNEDAAPTINTNNNFRSRAVDIKDDVGSTTLLDMSHSSFDSGGWTYTVNSESLTTGQLYFYWAIEEGVAGAVTGVGAEDIAPLVEAGAGQVVISGAGAEEIAALTEAGVGALAGLVIGAGGETIAVLIEAGAGQTLISGAGAETIAALVEAGAGQTLIAGAGAETIAALVEAGIGQTLISGAGAETIAALVEAGAGQTLISALGAETLAALVEAGTGIEVGGPVSGAGAETLAALVEAGIAQTRISGVGAQSLAALVEAATGQILISGAGAETLAALEEAGAGTLISALQGVGAETLAALVETGAGRTLISGAGAESLAALVEAAQGTSGAGAVCITMDTIIEGNITFGEWARIVLAAVAGKASGLDTLTPKYRDQADTKDRIDAVTDASGNRSDVTVDGS
jgi:hypothetical protein